MGTPEAPAAPAITITATGTTIVAAIAGQSGATHYLKYKGAAHTAWQAGGSRSGDGNITLTGLTANTPYIFTCYSQVDGGVYSLPAVGVHVIPAPDDETVNDFDTANIASVDSYLDMYGKEYSYLPRTGGSRAIKMIVDYMPVEQLPGMAAVNSARVTVTVANDATKGISTAEFDSGGDMVNIPWPHEYSAKQNRNIVKKISEDAGMVTYEIR
jgi:hypothetical protein